MLLSWNLFKALFRHTRLQQCPFHISESQIIWLAITIDRPKARLRHIGIGVQLLRPSTLSSFAYSLGHLPSPLVLHGEYRTERTNPSLHATYYRFLIENTMQSSPVCSQIPVLLFWWRKEKEMCEASFLFQSQCDIRREGIFIKQKKVNKNREIETGTIWLSFAFESLFALLSGLIHVLLVSYVVMSWSDLEHIFCSI